VLVQVTAVPLEATLLVIFLLCCLPHMMTMIRLHRFSTGRSRSEFIPEDSHYWPQGPAKMLRRRNDDPRSVYAEYAACIDDLIYSPTVQALDDFKHHQNVSRLDHVLNVSFTSYSLCRTLGWDYRSAARGGVLHDLFLYDWRTTTLEEGRHGFAHPRIALNNAQEEFELNPVEQDIILKHMFPLTKEPPRCKESVLVCLVDKFCALQEIFVFGISARSYAKGRHLTYLQHLQG
jgi:uncharacterized protein